MTYASNTPISRPVNEVENPDADCGGFYWDRKRGIVFKKTSDRLPFRKPNRGKNE